MNYEYLKIKIGPDNEATRLIPSEISRFGDRLILVRCELDFPHPVARIRN